MALAPPPTTSQPPELEPAPLLVPWDLRLTPEQFERVVELASPSDEGPRGVTALRRKMDQYQANGARLGWLLLPEERAVEIWRGSQEGMAERLDNASRLDGGELAEGLAVELEEIWAV